ALLDHFDKVGDKVRDRVRSCSIHHGKVAKLRRAARSAAIRGGFLVSNQTLAFRQEAIHCISPFCSRRLVAARQRQYDMSNSPDTGLDLEELELQLLPAWAKQSPDT